MDRMVAGRIAIIPARGGSKRIPRKNVIDFFGKPMIAWTIEAAIASGCFDRILVSTDDEEIADVSIQFGAEVPFLRKDSFDDHAPVSAATISSLIQAEAHWSSSFSSVVQLMANCPMRSADHIRTAVAAFEGNNRIFQISCFKFGWMNPWWAMRLDESGGGTSLFPKALDSRSQDLPELYCPTGAIWIANSNALRSEGTFHGSKKTYEPIEWWAAVDIDDHNDLEMAQAVFLMQRETVR